jgi:integrase
MIFGLRCLISVSRTMVRGTESAFIQQQRIRREEFLDASVAVSTKKSYDAVWRRWTVFAEQNGLVCFPMSVEDCSLFITFISSNGSKSTCISAAASISRHHDIQGVVSPARSPVIRLLIRGVRYKNKSQVKVKSAISLHLLRRLLICVDIKGILDSFASFYFSIAFFAMLRYNDFTKLRFKDFNFHSDHLQLYISESKTDKLAAGSTVVLAKLEDNVICPWFRANRYFTFARSHAGFVDTLPVLTSIVRNRFSDEIISYSCCTKVFRRYLRIIGYPQAQFSLHSFRSGGATAAATAGVSRENIALHGRWKSNAMERYIRSSVAQKKGVSTSMANVI